MGVLRYGSGESDKELKGTTAECHFQTAATTDLNSNARLKLTSTFTHRVLNVEGPFYIPWLTTWSVLIVLSCHLIPDPGCHLWSNFCSVMVVVWPPPPEGVQAEG